MDANEERNLRLDLQFANEEIARLREGIAHHAKALDFEVDSLTLTREVSHQLYLLIEPQCGCEEYHPKRGCPLR